MLYPDNVFCCSLQTSNFNWQAEGVGLAHKYAEPQDVDVTVANAGGGAVLYHVLTLRARQILAQSQLSSVASLPNALAGIQPPPYFRAHTDMVAQAETSSKGSNQSQDTPSASGVADSKRQKVVEGPDAGSGSQSLGRHGMGVEDTPRPHTQPAALQAEGAQGSQRAVQRSSTLIMKEAMPPTLSSIQPLMVVADSRGRVCHVTLKMAELLGRSVEALRANGMEHAFSALLLEPFSHMHHSLLQATTSSVPPPHSCRSGLIQLLQRTSGQGQTKAVPFQLQIKRRTGVEAVYHVATFTEATMEQALDERRLLLEVDADGLITGVSSGTPTSLFALDPATLPGMALDAVLDFMHPITAQDARVAEEPGLSWRVGVGMAGAQTAPSKVKGKARTMLGKPNKPAIMTISVAFNDPHMASLDSMQIMVELWRADLACSVIEINASGQVVPLGCDELNALCPSGLVLGAPLSALLDQPLSSLLPCLAGKSLTDLFHEGALGPPPSGFAAAAPALKAAEKKGGRARAKGLSMSEMRSSPTHIIRVSHLADAADLTLSLQVVRRSGSPGYFVVLHPLAPRTSRPDLAMFLLGEPAPDAQGHAAVTDGRAEHRKRRASIEFFGSAALTRPSQSVLGSLAMTSHPLLKPSHQAHASIPVSEQPPVPLHPGHLPSTVPDPPTSHGQLSRQQSLIQGDKGDVEHTLVESLAANSSKGGVAGQGTHTELEGVSRRSSLQEEELDASSTSSSQAEVVTRTVSGKPSSRDAMIMAWLNGDQGPGIPQDSSISSLTPALASGPADSPTDAPDAPVKEQSNPHSQASFTKAVWRPLPAASSSAPPVPQPVLGNEASVRGGRLLQAIARGSVRAGNQMFQAGSGSMAKLRLSEVGEGKAGARARSSWEPAGVMPGADEAWARNSGGSMPSLREGAVGEQEVEELEDAEALDDDDTIGDSHYLRGKRFKKLFKLLSSDVVSRGDSAVGVWAVERVTAAILFSLRLFALKQQCLAATPACVWPAALFQVQQPVQRYRTHTLFLVLLLIAVHTGCFALMYTIVGTQSKLVATLGDVGTAGILATEVAMFSRTLNMHYSNMTVPDGPGGPGLRLASSPEDLPYLKQVLSEHIDAFYTMHQRAYADADSLKGIVFTNIAVNQSLGNFSTLNLYNSTKLKGLWTAGNQLAAKARSLLQSGEAYLRTLGPSIVDFMYNPDLLYIVTNGPNLVFEGYKSTMDIYMQIVISSSASANNLQLVLLAAEGGVLCLLCVVWVWLLLRAVAERRYQMYQILMVVPGGLVRHMATQRLRLGDESEDEEDEHMLTAPTLTAQVSC
ncbi:hypothetical protein QJQ45_011248 [Haematococcus lacustris]|nr:hypothetical protein QJQ45_011248 [Haematococcus lacustris]